MRTLTIRGYNFFYITMELFHLIPLIANYFCMSAVIFYNNGFVHFGGLATLMVAI